MENGTEIPEKYSKEGLNFEAKSAPHGIPADFWETYSAFANTFGGTVVLGISEDESRRLYVTGVEDPEGTVKTLWDNLDNPRFVNCNILKDDDVRIEELCGLQVISVHVPPAERRRRPVYIRNNVNSGTFKRNNEGDYHCRMDEIKEMIRDSEDTPQDNEPVSVLTADCFDDATVSRYLSELSARRPGHPWARVPREEFLQLSGAAVSEGAVLHPSTAGLLMFGKVSCIRRIFGGYFLDYRESDGGDRWSYRYHSNSGEWSGNIYDFVSEVMNRISVRLGSPFSISGYSSAGCSEKFLSVREAVMNAVIHADYRLSSGVSIEFSPGSIRICNPGSMRVSMDVARAGGCSDPRNTTLMALAMAIGWVERIGSGIYEIERSVKTGDLAYADIREHTDPSSVEALLGLSSGPRDANGQKIIELIRGNPRINRTEMAESIGISVASVGLALARLKAEGRVERVGSNKSGYWKVL